jgi:tRNA dimethylallyltransferase
MLAWAEGRLEADEALAALVLATRRFAKRQRTWFRHEPDVLWRHPERDRGRLSHEVETFLAAGVRPAPAAA